MQHEITRVQQETTPVQNKLEFILIICMEPGILGSKAVFMLQKLEN